MKPRARKRGDIRRPAPDGMKLTRGHKDMTCNTRRGTYLGVVAHQQLAGTAAAGFGTAARRAALDDLAQRRLVARKDLQWCAAARMIAGLEVPTSASRAVSGGGRRSMTGDGRWRASQCSSLGDAPVLGRAVEERHVLLVVLGHGMRAACVSAKRDVSVEDGDGSVSRRRTRSCARRGLCGGIVHGTLDSGWLCGRGRRG